MQRYGHDHWEVLYRENRIPWDAGRVPEGLERYIATDPAAVRVTKRRPLKCASGSIFGPIYTESS